MPLGAVAVTMASPGATAVATPAPFTVAIAVELLDQVNDTPAIGWLAASSAVAVNVCVPPCVTVAVAGATVTLTTGAGGGPSALHAPTVGARGPVHTSPPLRWSDCPTGEPGSVTPMSTESIPLAGPPIAVIVPSYERNSTTWPPAFTSAMPSGLPFWIPSTGYVRTMTPRSPHVAGTVSLSVRVL